MRAIERWQKDGLDFWVLLVWGNGEDLISDYTYTPEATASVYTWLEEVTNNVSA